MSDRRPPRFATWLLERLGNAHRNESLLGDLHEQYLEGKSDAWYWRQVATALLASCTKALRVHTPTLFAALAAAYVMRLLWRSAHGLFLGNAGRIHRAMFAWFNHYDTAAILTWVTGLTMQAGCYFSAGWIAVQVHRAHPRLVAALLLGGMMLFPIIWRSVIPPVDPSLQRWSVLLATFGCAMLGVFVGSRARRVAAAR